MTSLEQIILKPQIDIIIRSKSYKNVDDKTEILVLNTKVEKSERAIKIEKERLRQTKKMASEKLRQTKKAEKEKEKAEKKRIKMDKNKTKKNP